MYYMEAHMKAALIALALTLCACSAPGERSGLNPITCECPTPPDPVPCLRVGTALAGDADWLLVLLDGTQDATAIDAVVDELHHGIEKWESCSTELVRFALGTTPDTAQP